MRMLVAMFSDGAQTVMCTNVMENIVTIWPYLLIYMLFDIYITFVYFDTEEMTRIICSV